MAGPEVETFRDIVSIKMADPPWNYNNTLAKDSTHIIMYIRTSMALKQSALTYFNKIGNLFKQMILFPASVSNVRPFERAQIRVRIGILFSLFLIRNICCGYSKEPSQ